MRWFAILLTLSLQSCISVNYSVDSAQTPIVEDDYGELAPSTSDLGDVLDTLGAPHIVLDSLNGRVVLAYVWSETDDLGLQVSFGFLSRFARGARVRFDSTDGDFQGVVVICDPDLQVESIRRGPLVDLLSASAQDSVTSIVRAFLL